jgi:hypothetical protein
VDGTHYCCRKEDEADNEGPSLEHVAKWQDEDEASCVTGLEQGGNLGRLLIRDAKLLRHLIQDWLAVVQIGNGECARLISLLADVFVSRVNQQS